MGNLLLLLNRTEDSRLGSRRHPCYVLHGGGFDVPRRKGIVTDLGQWDRPEGVSKCNLVLV